MACHICRRRTASQPAPGARAGHSRGARPAFRSEGPRPPRLGPAGSEHRGGQSRAHESGQRTGEEPRRRRPCEGAAPGPCRAFRPHSEASHGRFTDPGAPRRPHRAPEWESSGGAVGGGVQFAFYCLCSRVRVTRYTFKTWGSGRGALQREATGAGGVRGCLSAGRLGGGGPRSRVGAERAPSVCVGMAVPYFVYWNKSFYKVS